MRRTKNNEVNETSESAQKIFFVSQYNFTYLYVRSLCRRPRVSANRRHGTRPYKRTGARIEFYAPSIFFSYAIARSIIEIDGAI